MAIERTFKLFLWSGASAPLYINANQYDSGETWLFELYFPSGARYIPETGSIVGIKSDGKVIANAGTVDSEGRVVIEETEQMTAAAGTAIFELLIDNSNHGTANFKVEVEPRPADNADMSDSDYSLLQNAVDSAEEILDIIGDTDLEEVVKEDIDNWLDEHPEATTTVQDGAITIPKLNDSVKYGTFEHMTVGTAQAVLSDDGITDKVPYKYRVTGGGKDAGNRALDTIVGGTVAWNQLNKNNASSSILDGVTFTKNGNGSWTLNGTANNNNFKTFGDRFSLGAGHVYYAKGCPSGGGESTFFFGIGGLNIDKGNGGIGKNRNNFANGSAQFVFKSGVTFSNITIYPQIIDLTQMFGTTIADAIYAMEQANAGAGVAWFKKLFPNDYYPYNEGELISVSGLQSKDTVGFNLFDKSAVVHGHFVNGNDMSASNADFAHSDYIPVIGGQAYYYPIKHSGVNSILWYDSSKTMIGKSNTLNIYTLPQNAFYVRLNMLESEVDTTCFNLSGDRNGEYEPYQKHSYPLDSSLTLRGVPKWADGEMYFDGDVYNHDGTVERRYGTRAYQSGDESLADAITDGANTVYKLNTPTSETADPYQQVQIIDPNGTEEYVSTSIVPVGHITEYPTDIVAKVNALPKDFSTLIAPTEKTFRATRNYTAKQFVIVNNQLYRVTANIANGGAITPNTNVVAVTIADILTSLI